MRDLGTIKEFEWDEGNLDKSYEKHGISPNEAEEVFLDTKIQIKRDFKHQEVERRFIAIGVTGDRNTLFIVFTMRKAKIRIISARIADRKERRLYEEKTKKNSKI